MPRPAHELLNPACAIKPAWAVFDPAWYLWRYADARAICAGKPPEAALLYYLRVGARLGHSPSALFDEQFYLARNPDIAELVRAAIIRRASIISASMGIVVSRRIGCSTMRSTPICMRI